MDNIIKFKLLEFYLQESNGVVTPKELQDWATSNDFDKHKVKIVNQ